MTLRLLDTFAGIGGFSLAAHQLGGFETIGFVEREPFCQQILLKNFAGIPIYDDITTFNPEPGSADVICGGFPCQDISTAGKQAGIKEGTRSGLFYELMRVVRLVRPQFVVLENVSAILANGLDTVLGELAEAGFDAEWACIPASAVGACHQRDRWWLIAYPSASERWAERAKGCGTQGSERIQGRQEDAGGFAKLLEVESANSSCQQRNDCGLTHATEPSRSAAKPRNCHSEDFANTNHQRQQEQHLAAIADQQRQPRWHDAPRRLNPDWRGYVSKPVLCRGDDGLSNRVDRLKALGNAVVPQVAMIPLQRVLDLHGGQR